MQILTKYEWNVYIPIHIWQDLYGEVTKWVKGKLRKQRFYELGSE